MGRSSKLKPSSTPERQPIVDLDSSCDSLLGFNDIVTAASSSSSHQEKQEVMVNMGGSMMANEKNDNASGRIPNAEQGNIIGNNNNNTNSSNNSNLRRSISPPQLDLNPPSINNYFHNNSGNNDSVGVGGGGTPINVDNIFASITDEVSTSSASYNNNEITNNTANNNIFQNFAAANNNTIMAIHQQRANIPIRKYSDPITRPTSLAANNNTIRAVANTKKQSQQQPPLRPTKLSDRSGSDEIGGIGLLSKSMDVKSLFLGQHRNMSESEADQTPTIRHAGYLFKRSNLPYTGTSDAVAASANTTAPVPTDRNTNNNSNLADEDIHFDVLPFGGLDDDSNNINKADTNNALGVSNIINYDDDNAYVHTTLYPTETDVITSSNAQQSMIYHDPTPTATDLNKSISYDDNEIDDDHQVPCFCSPIVQYFKGLFEKNGHSNNEGDQTKKSRDALMTTVTRKSVNNRTSTLPKKKKKESHRSPETSRSISNNSSASSSPTKRGDYTVQLKPPAKSSPVPISPRGDGDNQQVLTPSSMVGAIPPIPPISSTKEQQQKGPRRRRSSYSNSDNKAVKNVLLSTTDESTAPTSAGTTSAAIPSQSKIDYPAPPPSYIDPKDGHIWRSKYCILEEGILYFYKSAQIGESTEAKIERYESRMYSEELEDIVLGEELVFPNNTSPGTQQRIRSASRDNADYHYHRTTSSSNTRLGGSDQYDLSKSPMPMKRMDMFVKSPFHRQGSSVITSASDYYAPNDPRRSPSNTPSSVLHHSQSTSTFHNDADILWEKRVALDCVGAVRSSGQEYGENAFELLAYGTASSDANTGEDDSYAGGKKNEIIDRLILRAANTDGRNGWMFQFHRSLTSFVMQQFVNSVQGGHNMGDAGSLSGLGGGGSRLRPLSPHSSNVHCRLPSGGGSHYSPFVGGNSIGKQQSFATSPTGNNSFGGGSSFSPNIVASLSHGHGRNALYRRQVRDGKSGSSVGSAPGAASSPTFPTPVGTPLLGGSSPASEGGKGLKKKPLIPTMMIQSDSTKMQDKVELSSLRGLREGKEQKKDETASSAIPPPAAAPQKKYVPPHMRSDAAPPKKYIPPHMRRKLEAATATAASGSSVGDSDMNEVTAKTPAEKEVPINDESSPSKGVTTSTEDESLSDSAFSATSTSSLLSRQLLGAGVTADITASIQWGGCADPTVIIGSITDHMYIGRKASIVGNARLEAYGGRGGGLFTSFGRHTPIHRRLEGDDEESALLDDFDDMQFGSRSSANDVNANSSSRSVLKWEVGASSECGIRNSNEDAYVAINNLDYLIESEGLVSFSQQDVGQTAQQGLYAIFDGHVGNQAARYAAENFHKILMEQQSVLASEDSANYSSIEDRADTVLREAFDRLDRDFCRLCTQDGRDWDCGSTALVAFIVDDVVSLANLGDCRGVVCRMISDNDTISDMDGWEQLDQEENENDVLWDRASGGGDSSSEGRLVWKEITEDHSPLVDDERARIEKANGWIIQECEIPIGQLHRMDIFDNDVVEIVKRCFADRMKQHRSDPVRQIQIARTCGDLAVSRAIGDRDFKAAYNMPSNKEQLARSWEGPPVFIYPEGHSGKFRGDIVSNVPEIHSFKVAQEGVIDEFLLMACDGLWDVMDSDDAVRIAKELLFDRKLSAKDGAARLAELAQHLGSSDNITVIVIRFYWEESLSES